MRTWTLPSFVDSRARRWLLFGVGLLLAGTGVAIGHRPVGHRGVALLPAPH